VARAVHFASFDRRSAEGLPARNRHRLSCFGYFPSRKSDPSPAQQATIADDGRFPSALFGRGKWLTPRLRRQTKNQNTFSRAKPNCEPPRTKTGNQGETAQRERVARLFASFSSGKRRGGLCPPPITALTRGTSPQRKPSPLAALRQSLRRFAPPPFTQGRQGEIKGLSDLSQEVPSLSRLGGSSLFRGSQKTAFRVARQSLRRFAPPPFTQGRQGI